MNAGIGVVAVLGFGLVAVVVRPSAADERQNRPAPASSHASAHRIEQRGARRLSRVVDGVRFSFELPKCCWEQGPPMSTGDGSDGSPHRSVRGRSGGCRGDHAGTRLINGASRVTVSGRAARHVVLTVRKGRRL
jgi:hypothetical protein